MSLLPDDPFKQLANVRKEFERMFSNSHFPFDMSLFDNLLGNFGSIKIDVYETETEVIARCDIPGIEKKEDIQINVEQHMLSISGFTNTATEIKKENIFRKELYANHFHRSVFLPSPVSREGVLATYRNGVLEVRMQKATLNNVQNIDIDFY